MFLNGVLFQYLYINIDDNILKYKGHLLVEEIRFLLHLSAINKLKQFVLRNMKFDSNRSIYLKLKKAIVFSFAI